MKVLIFALACVAYASAISVENCNKNAPVTVGTVWAPEVLKIKTGEQINLMVKVKTTLPITGGLKISFALKKKVGWFWIPVPCSVLKLCDVVVNCAMLSQAGLPCPGKPGKYTLRHSIILPKIPPVPSIFANGQYKFEGSVSVGGKKVGCVLVEGKVEF